LGVTRHTTTTCQDLAETISRLSRKAHCGELAVRHGKHEDRVLLRSGLICGARVSGVFMPLGQILVRQGRLTIRDLRASLERMALSERLQGQLLTEMGLVSRLMVEHALRSQLRRRVLHLLALRRVSVELSASPSAAWPPLPPLEPLELICAHVRALQPDRLLAQVGRMRTQVRLSRRCGRLTSSLDRVEIEQLRRLDGVFRPASFVSVGDLPLARVILIVQQLGLLRSAEPQSPPNPNPNPNDEREPAVKRSAYLRLVQQLHPDRHPQASEARRAELGQRLAEVNAAYERSRRGSC
jgi:hypothetical protein